MALGLGLNKTSAVAWFIGVMRQRWRHYSAVGPCLSVGGATVAAAAAAAGSNGDVVGTAAAATAASAAIATTAATTTPAAAAAATCCKTQHDTGTSIRRCKAIIMS